MRTRLLTLLALAYAVVSACVSTSTTLDRAGEVREIRLRQETNSKSADGSTGSSRTGFAMVERVLAVGGDGVQLEYDLPDGASAEERDRSWQFPARVLKTPGGQMQLLNTQDLKVRLDAWLLRGKIPREACGLWVFTWTAIKIECDPRSILLTLAPFDLRYGDLKDGALHGDTAAIAPAPLRSVASGADGATFAVSLQVDPNSVRRERAESRVALAQIMNKGPLSLDDAVAAEAETQISGTIELTLVEDATGRVVKTTRVIEMDVAEANGKTEHSTATTTVEQSLLSP